MTWGYLAIFLAFLAWGIWGFASFQAVQRAHPLTVQWIISLPYIVVTPLWYALSRKAGAPVLPERGALLWALLAFTGSMLGSFFYNQALRTERPSLVIGISSAYPLLSFFLLVLSGHESFRWPQLVGLGLVVIGVVLLQQA